MKISDSNVIPRLAPDESRAKIRSYYLADEARVVNELIDNARLSIADRRSISEDAAALIMKVRRSSRPSMMENFRAEYGLTSKEGVALMCLAEALLRVPDAQTIDELIEDKISHGNWGKHLGHSESQLVNVSTWALLLTGKVIAPAEEKKLRITLQGLVKRMGEPLVRTAVAQAMKELGRHFVLGSSIQKASRRAREREAQGYTYSYDMLGEAARTETDARRYHLAYSDAITALAPTCTHEDIRDNPGISVKLSALHARYEIGQYRRVMTELVARTSSLAVLARSANMGFNIDAEEADRLDISLDVIEAVLGSPALKGWDGFGVVVQAFSRRANHVLDWLYDLAQRLDRKIMVRLVKGAYWDTEIKRAQVLGLADYPVFTRKVNTDVSYLACVKKLFSMTDRIYPQFATHNAHSVAAVLRLARGEDSFEFQRLHGMGESLHDFVQRHEKARCRIYAPVGRHQDLLAYLVRRLLENGANSSFVNQIVDTSIEPESIARDPVDQIRTLGEDITNPRSPLPGHIYGDRRRNSKGWDITDLNQIQQIHHKREAYRAKIWQAGPLLAIEAGQGASVDVFNPANSDDLVGRVTESTVADIESAIQQAGDGFAVWADTPVRARADCLRRLADLYESNAEELFALAAREAGKNWLDAIGEVREAVDFALFYANEAERVEAIGIARGIIVCISPWNFPLAIFSGQILAAIAAGNSVIAKPAEQTSLIAARAVELMLEAGIPASVVQLLPGPGASVGAALTSDSRIGGICFTGSTRTAQLINRNMARHLAADAPLIAETGGLNAMIVDSSALPEQVIRDVLASSFQSAGQRCSALRMLYVQKDVADKLLEMLFGAMDELCIGDPWLLETDIGPVIDRVAKSKIENHCRAMAESGKLMKQLEIPVQGLFVAPTVIRLGGIDELKEEIFGPVLHVATFEADEIDRVVDAINARGFGLTFGIHTRVDTRVEQIVKRIRAGNIYVNRNQIGAVVGSQPFGGEGLSGTGPKAGGPSYVQRFRKKQSQALASDSARNIESDELQDLIDGVSQSQWSALEKPDEAIAGVVKSLGIKMQLKFTPDVNEMPGPTGEANRLSTHARGLLLCLGPTPEAVLKQAISALALGNAAVLVAPGIAEAIVVFKKQKFPVAGVEGRLTPEALRLASGFHAVLSQAENKTLQTYRLALAEREGVLVPLITEADAPERLLIERHLCIDTTAAGGNASLIAAGS
ncbi:MAG: bifunctional proline dehydrogenase/L-glutamate gamma-semialdehyde dehydrogenase PutA [Gammaproteobacteria bacterium]|nr:bifunctional proline dehydrogenase/L-glutamate gamma-semialdehyde dehydrogenase PutA [Gammaproteobacteria bacterium]